MNQAKQALGDLGICTEITLRYPITNAMGETVRTITVRRPRVGDLRAVAALSNESEQELAMFSRLTGWVPEDLDLLDLADYQAVQAFFRTTIELNAQS